MPNVDEPQPWWNDEVRMLVRDFTQVGSIPKSEGVRRIAALISEAERRGYERAKEEIERKLWHDVDWTMSSEEVGRDVDNIFRELERLNSLSPSAKSGEEE